MKSANTDELDQEGAEIARQYAQVRRQHPLIDELFNALERVDVALEEAAGVLTESERAVASDTLFDLTSAVEVAVDRLADEEEGG